MAELIGNLDLTNHGKMISDVQQALLKSQRTTQEAAVLGCVFNTPALATVVRQSLRDVDFIDPRHRSIFNAISDMNDAGKETSPHGVAAHIPDKDLSTIGGLDYLISLQSKAPDPTKLNQHISYMREQTIRRSLIKGLDNVRHALGQLKPTANAISDMRKLADLASGGMDEESGDMAALYDAYLNEPVVRGVSTGFDPLDEVTGGMKPGTLWVVAAYSGTGKTTWMVKAFNSIQLNNREKCLFISLEMTPIRLVDRIVKDVEGRYKHPEVIRDFNAKLYKKKRTLGDIEYAIVTEQPKVVFIDYVQIIPGKGNLFDRMTHTAHELQRMAQEHNCCIVVASQVSNEHAKDPSDKVMSAKGGQDIVAAADVFVELSRKKSPDEEGVALGYGKFSDDTVVTMGLRKNRDGPAAEMEYRVNKKNFIIDDSTELL